MSTSEKTSARRPLFEMPDEATIERLRRMTPQERLQGACDLWHEARSNTRESVQKQHPDWTEAQVLREVANILSNGETERALAAMELEKRQGTV